jgi:hypothetical protein
MSSTNNWNESNLERVIQTFNPASFFSLPSNLFNNKGDLRYCNTEPLKLTRGKWKYYTPYNGWIRYGLDIDKFGNSGAQWLACDGAAGEWAVGFHGFRRDVLKAVQGIAVDGFKVFEGEHSEWGTTSEDVGPNAQFFNETACGKGVFLTEKIKHLAENVENCPLIRPIPYNKHYYVEVILQCRIHPKKIRIPKCGNGEYYIVNDPRYVRPYGLLVRFLPASEAQTVLADNNFNFKPATEYNIQGSTSSSLPFMKLTRKA